LNNINNKENNSKPDKGHRDNTIYVDHVQIAQAATMESDLKRAHGRST